MGGNMQVDLINHFGVFMGSGDDDNFFGNSHFTHQGYKSMVGKVGVYELVQFLLYNFFLRS